MNAKKMMLTGAMLALMGSAAYADESYSWTGCYLGLEAGMAAHNTQTKWSNFLSIDGFGGSGGTYGGMVGCDYQFNNTNMVIGVLGSYDWFAGVDSSITLPKNQVAHLEYDSQWMLGGRMGFVVHHDVLLYGLAGFTGLETKEFTVIGKDLNSPNFTGYTVGGGLETALGKSFRLGAEYRYNKYGEEEQAGVFGKYDTLALEPEVQTVRLTLKWVPLGGLFGQPEPAYSPPLK